MKQFDLFGEPIKTKEEKAKEKELYTKKIKAPIYEPNRKKPNVLELVNDYKSNRLINEINQANITQQEKEFLIKASRRHNVFYYEKVADYYAHSSKEMQELMEKSGLIIIDFEKAIQYGYVKLSKEIADAYLEDYGETKPIEDDEE